MLRKTLPFVFILLTVLVLVWLVPQCSRPPQTSSAQAPSAAEPILDKKQPVTTTRTSIPQTPEPPPADGSEPEIQTNNIPLPEALIEPDPVSHPPPQDVAQPSAFSARPKTVQEVSQRMLQTEETIQKPMPENALTNKTEEPPIESVEQRIEPEASTSLPADVSGEEKQSAIADSAESTSTIKSKTRPDDAPSKRPAPETTIVLDGVNFARNSDQLTEGSSTVLDNVIASLKKTPEIKLEIAGYTDDQGDPLYNRILSRRRAEAVMIYLVEHDIDARRLTAAGYGSDDPIADNNSAEGRRKNRRVELHIR